MISRGYEVRPAEPDVIDEVETAEAHSLARPWPRYWARYLDVTIFGALIFVGLGFLGWTVPDSVDRSTRNAYALLVLPFALLLEALVLTIFRRTPAKALAGIKIVNRDGSRVAIGTALRRAARIWFFGMAIGIPIIALGTMVRNYVKLKGGALTSWDDREGTRVVDVSSGISRTTITAAIAIGLTAAFIALPIAMETTPAAELASEVPDLNQGLPKQVDNATRLDRISAAGTTIYYDYTLTDDSGRPLPQEKAAILAARSSYLVTGLQAATCQRKATNLLSHGMTMDYRYSGAGGVVKEVRVSPQDCA